MCVCGASYFVQCRDGLLQTFRIEKVDAHIFFMDYNVYIPGGGGGRGYSDFSHIRRLRLFFGVQNSEFQYFLGVFRKMNNFLGHEDFVDIFWGHHKIGLL